MSFTLALYQALKAIGAPVLTAYAVVDEEETAGVILVFHRSQSRVVRTPERSPPRALEEVALRQIRTRVSHHLQQFIHRTVDGVGIPAGCRQIGIMPYHLGERRRAAAGNDCQGERVQYYGIHRGVFGRRQNVRARSGESFVEMQRYAPVAAAGEQRTRQGAFLILLKERRGQPGGAGTRSEERRVGEEGR